MTTIIVSGEIVINETADDSAIDLTTGTVTRADGSSYILGDLHGYDGPTEVHSGVSLPDSDPAARSYLRWTGTAVVAGPDYPSYRAVKINAATADAVAAVQALIAAGLSLVSTGTPSLNATYSIDTDAKSVIDGIYSGIKNGDGLPGGGATFVYRDILGGAHSFDETTFAAFAKATRDYLYALAQGATPGTVTIP